MKFFFFFWRNTRQNVRNKRIEPKHDIKTSICTKNYIYKNQHMHQYIYIYINQQDTCIHSKIEAQSRILDPTTPFSVFSLNLPKQHKVRAQTSKFPTLTPSNHFISCLLFFQFKANSHTVSHTHTFHSLSNPVNVFSLANSHTIRWIQTDLLLAMDSTCLLSGNPIHSVGWVGL